VEINVKEQVQNLTKTPIIQQVRRQEQRPALHGWVYDLRTGYLKEVVICLRGTKIVDIQEFELDRG
jgi:carbonic anhydrase